MDLTALLDLILEKVPASECDADANAPLMLQPFNLAYDNFMGRLAVGRIYSGTVKPNQNVFIKKPDGTTRTGRTTKIFTFKGLERVEGAEANAGDIALIAGLPDIYIGETVTTDEQATPLPAIAVDEPTIALNFLVNNSPFAGKEGKYVTTRQLRDRLEKELEVNVGLKVDFRISRILPRLGSRRAPYRRPAREHAPRGLRAPGLPAAGHHPRRERREAGAV